MAEKIYSGDELKREIIQSSIRKGNSYEKTNQLLEGAGLKPGYNPLVYSENWKNLPGRLNESGKNVVRDMRTFGGMLIKPVVDIEKAVEKAPRGNKQAALVKAFKNAVNDDTNRKIYGGGLVGGTIGTFVPGVGTLGGAMLGASLGASGGLRNFANSLLSSYDLSLDDMKLSKWRNTLGKLTQGAFRNPAYALMDTSPLTLRAGSKMIRSIPEKSPRLIKELFPSIKQREFNRQINQSLQSSRADLNDFYQGYLGLDTTPLARRKNILNYLITNEGELTKKEKLIADRILNDLVGSKRKAIDYGHLDRNADRINTAAQYVMYKLPNNNLLHDDIVRILSGDELRSFAKSELLNNPNLLNKIRELGEKGLELADKDKITIVTQALSNISDPMGLLTSADINKFAKDYFSTKRVIGKQDIDTWSKKLDDSLKHQLDQVTKGIEFEDTISDLIRKNNIEQLTKDSMANNVLDKDVFTFNPKAFKEYLKTNNSGEWDIKEALKASNIRSEGSYAIDKMYMDMIKNAFNRPKNTVWRRLLNSFKKVALANPHWLVENRVGNLSNHFIDGGTFKDYADARWAIKNDLVPNELKTQTSYGSYVKDEFGVQKGLGVASSIKQGINKSLRGIDRFSASNKGIGDYGALVTDTLGGVSDIFSNPWFKFEAGWELRDRLANFIKQCKEEANKSGRDWRDILRESKNNKQLFEKLNHKVNLALGDYIGRNYAYDPKWYEFISETIPFYRFLTQTGRTSVNQMMNRPLSFASTITIPPRVANKISEQIIDEYGLDPDKYRGGVVYNVEKDGEVRTVGTEPLPIATLLNLGRVGEVASMLSPMFNTIPNIISYRKFDRKPTSPGLTEAMMKREIKDPSEYKHTPSEFSSYLLTELLDMTNSLYRQMHTTGKDFANLALGTPYQSGYDTNPFITNPSSFKKILPSEKVGKYFGIQTAGNFKKPKDTPRKVRERAMNAKRIKKRINNRSNREIK